MRHVFRLTASNVEVFKVNHPKTETAYAWFDADGNFTALLCVPPATDPRNAVKVSIVAAAKKGKPRSRCLGFEIAG
jgi:hypothetical protein